MKKHLKLNASSINQFIIFLFMLVLVLGCGNLFKSNNRKKLTAQAPATITKHEPNKDNADVSYTFTVNGKTYEGKTTKILISNRMTYPVGMKAIACYNPNNPEESEFQLQKYPCGE